MHQFGVQVQQRGRRFTIRPQRYRAVARYTVEGDASAATYWWALAAITRSHITVTNVSADTLQPDIRFLKIMQRMGCTVGGTTVIGPWDKPLRPVTLSMADCPDAVMSVAVVAALADGTTTIQQIHHLVAKESNRLQAVQLNLRRLGISARATSNTLSITGRKQPLWTDTVHAYSDHRLAMAFAILGLARGGVSIDEPNCVAKSYPAFWRDLAAVQHHAKRQHLILTGMRGVGKTTLGRQLAQQLHRPVVDLDQATERRVRQPIADYVAQRGWPAFRKIEHDVFRAITHQTGNIIATGGGTLIQPGNQTLARPHYVVLLTAPLRVIAQRLQPHTHRPRLLANSRSVTSELRQVWRQRRLIYYHVADTICRVG
jgi:shikimate kinase